MKPEERYTGTALASLNTTTSQSTLLGLDQKAKRILKKLRMPAWRNGSVDKR